MPTIARISIASTAPAFSFHHQYLRYTSHIIFLSFSLPFFPYPFPYVTETDVSRKKGLHFTNILKWSKIAFPMNYNKLILKSFILEFSMGQLWGLSHWKAPTSRPDSRRGYKVIVLSIRTGWFFFFFGCNYISKNADLAELKYFVNSAHFVQTVHIKIKFRLSKMKHF